MPRALLTAVAFGLPAWLGAQQPEFPATVEVVRIDAVVLDREGRPVEGLRASDFELLEDGRPQAFTSFEAVTVRGQALTPLEVPKPARPAPADGAFFGLFYDDLHLAPSRTAPARDAIRRFLAEAVRPGDRVTVVAPGQGIWWTSRLDEERDDLLAVVDRLRGRRLRGDSRLDYQALLVHQRGEEGFLERSTTEAARRAAASAAKQAQDAADIQKQVAQGGGAIPAPPSRIGGAPHPDLRGSGDSMQVAEREAEYADAARLNRLALGALRDVAAALRLVPGRKSLVVVSEGIVDDPEVRELEQVLDAARRANAALYFLDVRGLEGGSGYLAEQPSTGATGPPSMTVETLLRQGSGIGTERLADETGGRTLASNDLASGLRRVAAEAHTYYLLGYAPAEPGRPGARRITVRVLKPGLTVRSRPDLRRASTVEGGAATPDALDLLARSGADRTEVPLALSAYAFDETAAGRARVIVAADLDLPPSPAGTEVAFRLLVVPLGDGTPIEHGGTQRLEASPQQPWTGGFGTHAPLARAFELPPGRYQARLSVEARGRRGAASLTFDVPALAGLRLSSPILSDRLGDRLDRAPRPVVRGLRAFWPSATLYCQFEVFGSAPGPDRTPAVDAGYTLHGPDGAVARSAPPTRIQPTPEGRVLRLFGFPLAGLAPGVYAVTVDVRDTTSGVTATSTGTFRLVAVRR